MMYYTFPGSEPHIGTLVIFCVVIAAFVMAWGER
jgi:hypothetical protein